MPKQIVVIAHNIRSTHNVGSILRTCDGLGVNKLVFTGYTPYPKSRGDTRLPHISTKLDGQIHKTALGAEKSVAWEYVECPATVIEHLKNDGYEIVGLEQHEASTSLPRFESSGKIALLLGEEVHGIESSLMKLCDRTAEIPMSGKKESFNVSIAAAIALYHFRFML